MVSSGMVRKMSGMTAGLSRALSSGGRVWRTAISGIFTCLSPVRCLEVLSVRAESGEGSGKERAAGMGPGTGYGAIMEGRPTVAVLVSAGFLTKRVLRKLNIFPG